MVGLRVTKYPSLHVSVYWDSFDVRRIIIYEASATIIGGVTGSALTIVSSMP